MSFRKKLKDYLFVNGLHRADGVLLLLFVLLFLFAYFNRMPLTDAFSLDTAIDLGYSAKQGPNGDYYVLDDGHARLICFDKDSNVHFSIENPSDEKSESLYIDDFAVTEEGIYLSATEWDEMTIAREVVLRYDEKGKYIDTIVDREYSSLDSKKHHFYGICLLNGQVTYAECLSDSIIWGNTEITYDNAYNAVSEVVFFEDTMYVLGKDGVISAYTKEPSSNASGDAVKATQAYDIIGKSKIVPYRMSVDSAGLLYITDIRGGQVICVDMQKQTSEIVCDETSSLTVNLTDDGELLLLEEDGLVVSNKETCTTYAALQKNLATILLLIAWLLALLATGIIAIFLSIRLIYHLSKKKYTMPQIVSFWVFGTVSIVSVLLCWMLTNSFASSY